MGGAVAFGVVVGVAVVVVVGGEGAAVGVEGDGVDAVGAVVEGFVAALACLGVDVGDFAVVVDDVPGVGAAVLVLGDDDGLGAVAGVAEVVFEAVEGVAAVSVVVEAGAEGVFDAVAAVVLAAVGGGAVGVGVGGAVGGGGGGAGVGVGGGEGGVDAVVVAAGGVGAGVVDGVDPVAVVGVGVALGCAVVVLGDRVLDVLLVFVGGAFETAGTLTVTRLRGGRVLVRGVGAVVGVVAVGCAGLSAAVRGLPVRSARVSEGPVWSSVRSAGASERSGRSVRSG